MLGQASPLTHSGAPAAQRLHQQRIHPLHIRCRIGRHAAFGQQGLVKHDMRQIGKARGIALRIGQLADQGMLHVDFQHRLDIRHRLAGLAQHAGQLHADALLFRYQAGR